jgi:hypothetical protein
VAAPLRELLLHWLELRRETDRCTTVVVAPLGMLAAKRGVQLRLQDLLLNDNGARVWQSWQSCESWRVRCGT